MKRSVWLPICCLVMGAATFQVAGRDSGFSPFDMMSKPMDMFDASDRRRDRRERRERLHRRPPPPPAFGYPSPPAIPAPPGVYAPQYPYYAQPAQPASKPATITEAAVVPAQPEEPQLLSSEAQEEAADPTPVVKQTLPQGENALPSGYRFRPMTPANADNVPHPPPPGPPVAIPSDREMPGLQPEIRPPVSSQKLMPPMPEHNEPIMYNGKPAIFRPPEAGLTPTQ